MTCQLGLAASDTNPFELPRLIDTNSLHQIEFEGWLCGLLSFLPRRPVHEDEVIHPFYY
jgi:hypothetical protein